jgi:transposase
LPVIRQEISDQAWEWLEPLLPDRTPRRGGRWRDHRTVLEGIVWRFRTGAPWRDVPEHYGPWQTVYDRFNRWSADGTWDRLLARAQAEADARGEINWIVAVDSTSARVHQHGATLTRTAGNAATIKPTDQSAGEPGSAREDVVVVPGVDIGGPAGIFG